MSVFLLIFTIFFSLNSVFKTFYDWITCFFMLLYQFFKTIIVNNAIV